MIGAENSKYRKGDFFKPVRQSSNLDISIWLQSEGWIREGETGGKRRNP